LLHDNDSDVPSNLKVVPNLDLVAYVPKVIDDEQETAIALRIGGNVCVDLIYNLTDTTGALDELQLNRA
jgi:hypothetical protein